MFPRAKTQEPNHSCLPTPLAVCPWCPAPANLPLSRATPYLPQGQSSSSTSRGDGQKPSPTQSSVVNEWAAVSFQSGQPCPLLGLNS